MSQLNMPHAGKRRRLGRPYFNQVRSYQNDVASFMHKRAHNPTFSGGHMSEAADVVMTKKSNGKRKLHEAHLIPGLQEGRIYGFPNTIITKLRYCDSFTVTSTTGAIGFNTFNANSIFDPDATGIGHQPMFRDNYASIYDQYVVIGSKITVHFAAQTAQNWAVGICGDDDSAFSPTLSVKMESNNSVYTVLNGTGSGARTLTMTFEPNEDFGVDAKSDGSSQTTMGSNPSELWCFGVWGHLIDASLTGKLDFTVEIEYTVKCSELITGSGS
jgi:hypothetical protein